MGSIGFRRGSGVAAGLAGAYNDANGLHCPIFHLLLQVSSGGI
jgi:hypothetical protein